MVGAWPSDTVPPVYTLNSPRHTSTGASAVGTIEQ